MTKVNRYIKAVYKTVEIAKINKEIGDLQKEKKQEIIKNKRNYKAGKTEKDFSGRSMDGVPKKQTAGQKRNTARMKKVQKIAKQLKAKNPTLSHTEAVSKAWEQM